MPNEYSNFTESDVGKPNDGRQGAPSGAAGDPGTDSHWDPNVFNPQTQTNGAWVKNNQQTAGNAGSDGGQSRSFQDGAWGGQGNSIDAQGNDIAGTSGAALDVDRYRQMGQTPQYTSGPKIDTTQSGQSRDISMGALGLLGQTAAGTVPSAAEKLGTQQAQNADAAQFSMGQSVRGGPTNRAAASRHALMNAGTIDAQQRQANAATRAGEMANARGAYLNAASGQRGQDLGLATSQAGLDVGQRASNDQREGFYEGLGQSTQQDELGHKLGRTDEQDAAAAANFTTGMQSDAAAQARLDKNINTAIGGAQGVASAYGKVSNPGDDTTTKPNSDDNFNSDERTKTNVQELGPYDTQLADEDEAKFPAWKAKYAPKDSGGDYDLRGAMRAGLTPDPKTGHWDDRFKKPNHPTFSDQSQYAAAGNPGRWEGDKFVPPMSDKDAAKLKSQGDTMLASQKAGLEAGPSVGGEKRGSVTSRVKARTNAIANPYDDYDRSLFARSDDKDTAVNTDALHKGIEAQIAKDKPAIPDTMADSSSGANPYAHESLFGHAPAGYAKSRHGQVGSFGGPEASYKDRLWGPGEKDALMGSAPGTDDFASTHDTKWKVPVDQSWKRQVMTSDVHAKREAFIDGMKHGLNLENNPTPPEYARDPADVAAEKKNTQAATEGLRAQVAEADRRGYKRELELGRPGIAPGRPAVSPPRTIEERAHIVDVHQAVPDPYVAANAPGAGPPASVTPDQRTAMQSDEKTKKVVSPLAFKRENVRQPTSFKREEQSLEDYWAQHPLAVPVKRDPTGRERDEFEMTSDKRAKKGLLIESPMASANRSMAAHSYEYKPEFAGKNGQRVGEKNVGPMANPMAKDPIAKTAIVTDPDTGLLAIDKAKGLKLVMGGLADVQHQLDDLKKKKARR